MDHAAFQSWLDRYIDAWRLLDPVAIGDLFSSDVRYAYDPFEEAVVGRKAVVESWLTDPDEPGSWEADAFKILDKYGVEYCDRSVSMSEAARRAVEKTGGGL